MSCLLNTRCYHFFHSDNFIHQRSLLLGSFCLSVFWFLVFFALVEQNEAAGKGLRRYHTGCTEFVMYLYFSQQLSERGSTIPVSQRKELRLRETEANDCFHIFFKEDRRKARLP